MLVSQSKYSEAHQSGVTEIVIHSLDDFELSGTRYSAQGIPVGSIVLAGATGVPQGFYRRFANYAAEQAFKVRFLWNIVLPVLVKWKGYMAWSKLGMGEDLPLGVYRDWKRWCQHPGYFFDDEGFKHLKEIYAQVTIHYVAATSTYDLWAPPRSRDSFCQHYSGCELDLKIILPRQNQNIGHMGYFREGCKELWQDMLTWLSNSNPPLKGANQSATTDIPRAPSNKTIEV